jgi:hypothetical protein
VFGVQRPATDVTVPRAPRGSSHRFRAHDECPGLAAWAFYGAALVREQQFVQSQATFGFQGAQLAGRVVRVHPGMQLVVHRHARPVAGHRAVERMTHQERPIGIGREILVGVGDEPLDGRRDTARSPGGSCARCRSPPNRHQRVRRHRRHDGLCGGGGGTSRRTARRTSRRSRLHHRRTSGSEERERQHRVRRGRLPHHERDRQCDADRDGDGGGRRRPTVRPSFDDAVQRQPERSHGQAGADEIELGVIVGPASR